MKSKAFKCFFSLLFVYLFFYVSPVFSQEEDAGKRGNVENIYLQETEQLVKIKAVQSAFQFILAQNNRNREEHIMLTEIPAPPFLETKRGIKFASMLKEAGADSVWTDKVGNVLALRKGKKSKHFVGISYGCFCIKSLRTRKN